MARKRAARSPVSDFGTPRFQFRALCSKAVAELFTLGHSTRLIDDFLALLAEHQIARLVDVRTVPRSRHNPQFNIDLLPQSLERAGIAYSHMAALGGLRHTRKDSANTAWKNASFRGYADYMLTPEFDRALDDLIALADARAGRHHVRRGRTLALPPLAHRRRPYRSRHPCDAHHERRPHQAAFDDLVRPRGRLARDLSEEPAHARPGLTRSRSARIPQADLPTSDGRRATSHTLLPLFQKLPGGLNVGALREPRRDPAQPSDELVFGQRAGIHQTGQQEGLGYARRQSGFAGGG